MHNMGPETLIDILAVGDCLRTCVSIPRPQPRSGVPSCRSAPKLMERHTDNHLETLAPIIFVWRDKAAEQLESVCVIPASIETCIFQLMNERYFPDILC